MQGVFQSSHLNTHSYDPEARVLWVGFVNGAVYQFHGVPRDVYDSLAQSGSPGTYFHSKIKGQYRQTKLMNGTKKKKERFK